MYRVIVNCAAGRVESVVGSCKDVFLFINAQEGVKQLGIIRYAQKEPV